MDSVQKSFSRRPLLWIFLRNEDDSRQYIVKSKLDYFPARPLNYSALTSRWSFTQIVQSTLTFSLIIPPRLDSIRRQTSITRGNICHHVEITNAAWSLIRRCVGFSTVFLLIARCSSTMYTTFRLMALYDTVWRSNLVCSELIVVLTLQLSRISYCKVDGSG